MARKHRSHARKRQRLQAGATQPTTVDLRNPGQSRAGESPMVSGLIVEAQCREALSGFDIDKEGELLREDMTKCLAAGGLPREWAEIAVGGKTPGDNTLKPTHCDDYIHDHRQPLCLRWFLLVHRLPDADKILCEEMGIKPTLFADHEGKRVRVVMVSRFGDVGITSNLTLAHGYGARVAVEDLTNFSATEIAPPRARWRGKTVTRAELPPCPKCTCDDPDRADFEIRAGAWVIYCEACGRLIED